MAADSEGVEKILAATIALHGGVEVPRLVSHLVIGEPNGVDVSRAYRHRMKHPSHMKAKI